MSPEQIAADPDGIDTPLDVYRARRRAVRGAHAAAAVRPRGPLGPDAARAIRDDPPARPSAIHRSFRGDVETIVLKALEKDRARRYQSAAELAADIRPHLGGVAIERGAIVAVRPRHAGASAPQGRRGGCGRRGGDDGLGVFAAAKAASNIRLAASLTEQVSALAWTRDGSWEVTGGLRSPKRCSGVSASSREDPLASHWALWELYNRSPCLRHASAVELRRVRRGRCNGRGRWRDRAGKHRPAGVDPGLGPVARAPAVGGRCAPRRRRAARRYRRRLRCRVQPQRPPPRLLRSRRRRPAVGPSRRARLAELRGHTDWVGAIAWSPDGERLASSGRGSELLIWNTESFVAPPALVAPVRSISDIAFSPDGRLLAPGVAGCHAGDRGRRRRPSAVGDQRPPRWPLVGDSVRGAGHRTAGPSRRAASTSGSSCGTRRRSRRNGSSPASVACRRASRSRRTARGCWSARAGCRSSTLRPPSGSARSPRRSRAASASRRTPASPARRGSGGSRSRLRSMRVRMFELDDRPGIAVLPSSQAFGYCVDISPDGRTLIPPGPDPAAPAVGCRRPHAAAGDHHRRERPADHVRAVRAGRRCRGKGGAGLLASPTRRASSRCAGRGCPLAVRRIEAGVSCGHLEFDFTGGTIIAGLGGTRRRMERAVGGDHRRNLGGPRRHLRHHRRAHAPEMAVIGPAPAFEIRGLPSMNPVRTIPTEWMVQSAAFGAGASPGGGRGGGGASVPVIAMGLAGGTIVLHDRRTGAPAAHAHRPHRGRPHHRLHPHPALAGPMLAPLIASAAGDRTIRLWDLRTGDAIASIPLGEYAVRSLAFTPTAARSRPPTPAARSPSAISRTSTPHRRQRGVPARRHARRAGRVRARPRPPRVGGGGARARDR